MEKMFTQIYIAAIYPSGINPEDAMFFNHEDIDKVVFKGYFDEEGFSGLLIGGVLAAVAIYGLAKYDNKKTLERKNTPIKYPKGLDCNGR